MSPKHDLILIQLVHRLRHIQAELRQGFSLSKFTPALSKDHSTCPALLKLQRVQS